MFSTAYTRATADKGKADPLRRSYAQKRAEKRRLVRQRSSKRVVSEVSETDRGFDPLKRATPTGYAGAGKVALYMIGAVGVHMAVLAGFYWVPGTEGSVLPEGDEIREKVTFQVTEKIVTPPPAASPPDAPDDLVPLKPEAPPKPEPAPKPPKRFAKAGKRTDPKPLKNQLQADPVDLDSAPSSVDTTPRRRVVGISFESTVKGGSGPSFAVGNTRMGETAANAEDPTRIDKLAPENLRVGNPDEVGTNRVASYIPSSKIKVTRPKRISQIDLAYPRQLKEQGVEGNVVVLIRISTDGSVTRVKILKSSGYPEFDDAAKQTAAKERFAPATKNGDPIDYNLKYTYRFRIKEA